MENRSFFKTAKDRFGPSRSEQGAHQSAYCFLLLSFLAFTPAQWQVEEPQGAYLDWGEATTTARREHHRTSSWPRSQANPNAYAPTYKPRQPQ